MSLDGVIRLRLAEGRLILLEPILKRNHSRIVYMEATLHREISTAATSPDPDSFRIGQLVRDLDRFSSGEKITVGSRKERTCFMKRLEPKMDEVWEIRSRDPRPAYRLFCSFALPDVLIVLTYGKRADLGSEGSPAWKHAIRQYKTKWRALFSPYSAYQGTSANDYIQNNVVVIGDIA